MKNLLINTVCLAFKANIQNTKNDFIKKRLLKNISRNKKCISINIIKTRMFLLLLLPLAYSCTSESESELITKIGSNSIDPSS
jgi:hypothetical protein